MWLADASIADAVVIVVVAQVHGKVSARQAHTQTRRTWIPF